MKTVLHFSLSAVLVVTSLGLGGAFAANHAEKPMHSSSMAAQSSTMRGGSTRHLRAFIKINSLLNRMSQQQLAHFSTLLMQGMEKVGVQHPHYRLLEMLDERVHQLMNTESTTAPSLVTLALNTPDLSILKDIIIHLDLVDTIENGTFTVFAPTNAAFEQLLADLDMSFEQLAMNTELLETVVLYHLLPGRVPAAQVADLTHGTLVPTVGGESVRVRTSNGVYVDESKVITTDIMASNGVVHLIDTVLLPPSVKMALDIDTDRGSMDIVSVAASVNDFSTLVAAVQAAGLADALMGEGPFTVFAPTNEAFAALLASLNVTADELLADTDLLTQVLLYHVVPGFYPAADIVGMGMMSMLPTLQGSELTVLINDDGVMIDNVMVTATDVLATNGVIHVIDGVLMP